MNYANVKDYFAYLTNFERASVIKPGSFYSYAYASSKEYPIDILKFFDIFPLVFVTGVDPRNKIFRGLNFHHMPVPERMLWFKRMKIIINLQKMLTLKKSVESLPWMNYKRMLLIHQELDKVARNYRYDRVKGSLRLIPFEDLGEVLKFYARTYYGVGIKDVVRKFYDSK